MKRVVIVGGGFGGLNVAKVLGGRNDFQVTLVDRRNYHLFQPLLYQVAMAGLSPAEIAVPIRSILSGMKNTRVALEEVIDFDFEQKRVVMASGTQLPYDKLVLACGSNHSYFGNEHWEEFAPGLKTLEQATEIRRRVLTAFEIAERETEKSRQRDWLTFVVVGGGPTGVELAGALGEITRFALSKDFQNIDPKSTRVILIEGGPRILGGFDESLSQRATRDLEKMGVTVWTSMRVTDVTEGGVNLGKEFVGSRTVLWAAGVAPSPLNTKISQKLDQQGRVIVRPNLSIEESEDVYVIGDQAAFVDRDGETLPGLSPVAIQQGQFLAKNLIRESRGEEIDPEFRYFDKGIMATVGRSRAVVQVGRIKFTGFFAWVAWLFVHIYYLIGFRNRLLVLIQWAWAYFTFSGGARLIVSKTWRSKQ